MIHPAHLREQVVRPVLAALDMHSEAAEDLMMRTAMQESALVYLQQLGGGPALGLWQVEPATAGDCWANWLAYRRAVAARLRTVCGLAPGDSMPAHTTLAWNLRYCCAIARIVYRRAPESIPADVEGQARMWKLRYNTPRGLGEVAEFLRAAEYLEALEQGRARVGPGLPAQD